MSVYRRTYDPLRDISALDLADLRKWICENCGLHCAGRGGPERNHCIYPDRKFYHQKVSVLVNYELVCHICHQRGDVHTRAHRLEFLQKQKDRYGAALVDGWIDSLGLKDSSI